MRKAAIISIALIIATGCRTEKITIDTHQETDTTSKIEQKTETDTKKTIDIEEDTEATVVVLDTADKAHTLEEILSGNAEVKPTKIVYINKKKKEHDEEETEKSEKITTETETHQETEVEQEKKSEPSGDITLHIIAFLFLAFSFLLAYKIIKTP